MAPVYRETAVNPATQQRARGGRADSLRMGSKAPRMLWATKVAAGPAEDRRQVGLAGRLPISRKELTGRGYT